MISPHDVEFFIWKDASLTSENQWLQDITEAGIRFWGGTPYRISKLSELETHKQYAVIQSPGHIIHTRDFFNGLNNSLPFLIEGHVLAKEPSYLKLHPQCCIVNMDLFRLIVNPDEIVAEIPAFETSKDHFHDDYTPHYITSKHGTVKSGALFASKLIQQQLQMFSRMDAFSSKTRVGKHFFYSHGTYAKNLAEKQFELIKQKQQQCIYVMQTDDQIGIGHFDTVITPASGVKPALLCWNYNATNIYIYDISLPALEWQRHLKYTWDGKDLPSHFDSSKGFSHPIVLPISNDFSATWKKFLLEHPSWYQIWDNYKNKTTIQIHTVHCDLLAWDIPMKGKTLLDITNILTQPFLRYHMSEKHLYEFLVDKFNRYISTQLYIRGLTPKWNHVENVPVKTFIEELQREIQTS